MSDPGPSGRDGAGEPSDAEVDARFAELVGRFYSPAPDDGRGHAGGLASPLPPSPDPPGHGLDWLSGHPLYDSSFDGHIDDVPRFDASAFDETSAFDDHGRYDEATFPGEPLPVVHSDGFGPHPTGPFPRLSNPALAGTLLVLVSVTICLLSILGLPFPIWGRGLAVLGFLIGIALLLSRLPRRDDDSDPDDGAVL